MPSRPALPAVRSNLIEPAELWVEIPALLRARTEAAAVTAVLAHSLIASFGGRA